MKLLVIRHAIAMDREEYAESGNPDDLRALTRKGARRMERIAKALRREVGTIDRLATSPLTRAVETAEIVAGVYGLDDTEITYSLVPDAPLEEFEAWCGAEAAQGVVAIVGHEPHLGSLVTWLLTGFTESRIQLKKGGACLLEFESVPRRGAGRLHWLLAPRQLKQMAGSP
ncbi:MAG: histidine phosphatase family protein [Gemmatimonadaceae bacterium]|nr:histidine phosphatase family protein [Gemmatimonadaceae bacterium]